MRRTLHFAALAAAATLLAWFAASGAFAQQPPTARPRYVSSFPVKDQARQHDLALFVLDFAAGAATGLQRHGGDAFMTVVEGQVTLTQDGAGETFGPGGKFSIASGVAYSMSNVGSSQARVVQSILLSPGAPAMLGDGGAAPASGPAVTYQARSTLTTQPAEFNLFHLLIDIPAGGIAPLHDHAGPGLVMNLEGELVHGLAGHEIRTGPGDVVFDAGDHTARVVGGDPVLLWATFLIPPDIAPVLPRATSPSAPIQPPATGDAGLVPRESTNLRTVLLALSAAGIAVSLPAALARRYRGR